MPVKCSRSKEWTPLQTASQSDWVRSLPHRTGHCMWVGETRGRKNKFCQIWPTGTSRAFPVWFLTLTLSSHRVGNENSLPNFPQPHGLRSELACSMKLLRQKWQTAHVYPTNRNCGATWSVYEVYTKPRKPGTKTEALKFPTSHIL